MRVNTSGVIAYDDSTYLTGNQTITLSGIITGSGTTAITTAIADGALSIAKTSGLQTALDGKLSTTGKAADSDLLDGHDTAYFATSGGSTAIDFSVKALTMNGALSGATTGSFSSIVSATGLNLGSNYGLPKIYLYNDGTYNDGIGIYSREYRFFANELENNMFTWGKQTFAGVFTEYMRLVS